MSEGIIGLLFLLLPLAIVVFVVIACKWMVRNWKYVGRIILQIIKRLLLGLLFHQQNYQYDHLPHQSRFSSTRSRVQSSYPRNSSQQYRQNVSASYESSRRAHRSHQDDERRFGEYKCHHCGRKWTSAYSWANMGQECKACYTNVLPRRQEGLYTI